MYPKLLASIVFVSIHCTLQAETTAQQDYNSAKSLAAKGDRKAAYSLYLKAAEKARQTNNAQYEFFANYHAAFIAYRVRNFSETRNCVENALTCHKNAQNQRWALQKTSHVIKVELLGLAERCASTEQRITKGWQLNRQAIDSWKQLAILR